MGDWRLGLTYTHIKLKDACSLEEKLDSILKSRDITLSTNVHLVKGMVFFDVRVGL